MTKIVSLKNSEKKNHSFLSCIIRGTPFELNFFGKNIKMIGTLYKLNKMSEFYDEYWDLFVQGINNIDRSNEFNSNYVNSRYNALSSLEKIAVLQDCAEIFAFNNKLTYGAFVDVVNSYVSNDDLETTFFSPNDAV